MTRTLREELKKRGDFDSVQQEAALAIWRTGDLLENRIARLLREHGLTPSQYNVLRILRGEGQPLPCLEVASRMIQVAPAITRVVDQLLGMNLITKTQSTDDRRVHTVALTPAAQRLLLAIDQPLLDLHASLMADVPAAELQAMIRVLQAIRSGVVD